MRSLIERHSEEADQVARDIRRAARRQYPESRSGYEFVEEPESSQVRLDLTFGPGVNASNGLLVGSAASRRGRH
jgi:hypothetical protein